MNSPDQHAPRQKTLNNCPAPAKLNLFLHVTGRRPDGYHLLQTVFQLIDHGDLLHFTLREDGVIGRTSALDGVPEDTDLSVRAAKLLQSASGRGLGADIAIDKRLPMGGGLGGGSSDAATTLIALNHLWQCGLDRAQLMALGLRLGADVPFFIFGQNAFGEGVGDALTPLATPDCWYLVIEPGVAVPTAEIFCAENLTRDSKPVMIADFSSGLFHGFGKNDLQDVATRKFPAIAEALAWLGRFNGFDGVGCARMTGSGASVFCAFADEQQADAALNNVPAKWKAWKAKALAHHPLAYLLE